MKVKDCMCYEVACLTPDSTVEDCAKLMCNKHVGCIPVCDNNKTIVGYVHDKDLNFVAKRGTLLSKMPVCKECNSRKAITTSYDEEER